MRENREKTGSVEAFTTNWKTRNESKRNHFKRGEPANQIQFAFQNHWRVFKRLLGNTTTGRVLEVGAGRGSMSAFFADAGFDVSLLDTSYDVLKIAEGNFREDQLHASYICGDALHLPYSDYTFDAVLSIGLFEHFSEMKQPLDEQLRILKPGGLFLGYIVPERFFSAQLLALPLNAVLSGMHQLYQLVSSSNKDGNSPAKEPLFRNSYTSAEYLKILNQLDVDDCGSFGMFPVPLVSHSYRFPFSLMHPVLERNLVKVWRLVFSLQGRKQDPWICSEGWGLAFLVWARRKENP